MPDSRKLKPIDVEFLKGQTPFGRVEAIKLYEALRQLSDSVLKARAIGNAQLAHGSISFANLDEDIGSVIAGALTTAVTLFSTDIVFSATDADTVAWTAGTIKFFDGTQTSILAGNTGNMTGLTYIFYHPDASNTVLQVSTDYADLIGVGEDRLLLCVANKTTDATQRAFFIPSIGVFGINETNIGPFSISTGKVQASAITANEIAANTITAAKINVASLSSISISAFLISGETINGGVITAGSVTAATVRNTSSANSRIQLNTTAFTVTDSGGSEFFKIEPSVIGVNVYTCQLEQHPNISGAYIITTRQNTSDSDYVLLQATGTSVSTKVSSIRITPGAAGTAQIKLITNNTQQMLVDNNGITLGTLIPAATNITLSSGSFRLSSGQGIGTSLTAFAFDDTNGILGYTNVSSAATEALKIQDTTTKLRIAGTYYTLSVVAGAVMAT